MRAYMQQWTQDAFLHAQKRVLTLEVNGWGVGGGVGGKQTLACKVKGKKRNHPNRPGLLEQACR